MGLTKVPAHCGEEEHYVPGLNEAIVDETLFHQVQSVLKKIGDKIVSIEGDRKKQVEGLKNRIRNHETKIERCDEMLLDREIDRETH